MATNIVLGIRLSPNSFQRVPVGGVSLDNKVEQLKLEASKATNLPKHFLELIYCGNILDDDSTLQSCGLKPGVMVHVLKKKEKDIPLPVRSMTEADVQELVMAFRTFTRHPSYRSALHRLSRPEVLENIMMATPGLSDDPVALSIIQDPELLVHMENADTVRRIAELHPSLTEAANHIAAAVHEEAATGSAANQGSSSGYSYSLDALSDEEEMDSSQSSDSQPRGSEGLSRQQSYSTITAAQLAAALASATGLFPASSRTNGSGTSTGAGPSSSSSLITPEMFSQAMQQAIANVGPNTGPSDAVTAAASSSGSEGNPDMQTAASGLSRQLQQMHELGLTDDAINVQALQATGGDVHAAIDIVFSGALPPDTQ
ncbi:ubiquitin-like protein 7 isoform X2 [Periplaneta americana]